MKFTDRLWKEIGHIHTALIRHPFILELSQGTLQEDRFHFYVKQDYLYLTDYSRALALMAAKSGNTERMLQFLNFAVYSIGVEKERHQRYMAAHSIVQAGEKTPSCMAYTHFLLSVAALESVEVAMAAVLPCFWVYEKVAEHIYTGATENNPYREWIDLYAGEEFRAATITALEITDEMAGRTGETGRTKMAETFVLAAKMEYMFWDSAYRKEQWTI
jgi:thiaminase/transcriptional activator TenA